MADFTITKTLILDPADIAAVDAGAPWGGAGLPADILSRAIDLTKTCVAAAWHRRTISDALCDLGLSWEDADAFTSYALAQFALDNGGVAAVESADEHLTKSQRSRIF